MIFSLYPFTVVNHSCEYHHILSPVILPSEALNLGLVSGNLTQRISIIIIHIIQRRKLKYRKIKEISKFSSRLLVKVKNYSAGRNNA